jgi:AhpC/TSA family protein
MGRPSCDKAMRRPIAIAAVAAAVLVAGLALLDRVGGKGRGWPTSSLQALTKLTPVAGTAAPAFTLSDQRGRTVSLASLRGRIVVLESMDPECTLECPITSQEFVEAAHDLGRRSREAVFVGVTSTSTTHGSLMCCGSRRSIGSCSYRIGIPSPARHRLLGASGGRTESS